MGKKKDSENIRVVIRCRNLLPKELERGDKTMVQMDLANQAVIVNHSVGDPDRWTFDAVFNNTFAQRDIFVQEVQPLCDAVLQGYNATVFAYGQSGSGKTFTMTGDLESMDPAKFGMMPQVVDYLFNEVKKQTTPTKSFKVKVSYVELYNGKSRDLLAEKQVTLEIKQNMAKNFYVKGADVVEVSSFKECIDRFNAGTARRTTAATDLNDHSSRSHSLFSLILEQFDFENDQMNPVVMTSKINVVDLAGSEKLSKTNATGDVMTQGCNINLSLSALATVIDKIVKREKHIPYRGSPLTMLLKDSLGGNAKTVMFANVGPSDKNTSESISTLRFAERAKQIENKPVKNLDPKDARIQELMDKIAELERRVGGGGLDEEEHLRERIEQLEIENGELQQAQGKDTLGLEEKTKEMTGELEEAAKKLKEKEHALDEMTKSKEVMEQNFKQDLEHANELRVIATNFIKRACTAEQVQLIKGKMPPDVATSGDDKAFEVRELQYYLDGFLELFEDWRRSVHTDDDVKREVARAKEEVEGHMALKVQEMERGRDELMRQREEDHKNRNAANEEHALLKVDLAAQKDENAKLNEKIKKDIEKFKSKMDKVKTDARAVVEELDASKLEVTARDREIEKLKKMLEDRAAGGMGLATSSNSSPMKGGSSGNADTDKLINELEQTRMAKKVVETRMREMNLLLRRKGICLQARNLQSPKAGGEDDAAEALDDMQNDAFVVAAVENDSIDGDLVSQMQQQLRVQHRLHELRHAQQRKLDDLVRKYELLKTGQVTAMPSQGEGTISDEALQQAVQAAMQAKDEEFEAAQKTHEQTLDKLVKKLNKKSAEWEEKQSALSDEKTALEEEKADLTAHVDDLSKFNSQLALEVEKMRTEMEHAKTDADAGVQAKDNELGHLRRDIELLHEEIDEGRKTKEELDDLKQEYTRLQQQNARTEASLKEKMLSLDSNRQMIKWSNSLVEEEKKKVRDMEQGLRDAEQQYRDMEENWRTQMIENSNKLVGINNRRLEEQAEQYQAMIEEEHEKQKAMREKVKKAKLTAQKQAQKFDEMVLENEMLQAQFEDLKVSAMKMFRDQQKSATDDQSDAISAMIRGQRRDLDAFGGGGRPQSSGFRF